MFLGESTMRQSAYGFVWPLVWQLSGNAKLMNWNWRKTDFKCNLKVNFWSRALSKSLQSKQICVEYFIRNSDPISSKPEHNHSITIQVILTLLLFISGRLLVFSGVSTNVQGQTSVTQMQPVSARSSNGNEESETETEISSKTTDDDFGNGSPKQGGHATQQATTTCRIQGDRSLTCCLL